MTACPSKPIFPGWEQNPPNSVLWNGFPMAGNVNFIGDGDLVTIGKERISDQYIRITGVLVGIDRDHIMDEGSPPWGKFHPVEIHPVYSIDVIQNFSKRKPNIDLTGIWSATDVGTYYVRQIKNDVWWLGLSRDQGRTFANVFHGTIQQTGKYGDDSPKKIVGEWADIPLGYTNNNGNITLQGKFCLPDAFTGSCNNGFFNQQNLLETKFTSNGIFGGYNWKKLYDRTTGTKVKVTFLNVKLISDNTSQIAKIWFNFSVNGQQRRFPLVNTLNLRSGSSINLSQDFSFTTPVSDYARFRSYPLYPPPISVSIRGNDEKVPKNINIPIPSDPGRPNIPNLMNNEPMEVVDNYWEENNLGQGLHKGEQSTIDLLNSKLEREYFEITYRIDIQ